MYQFHNFLNKTIYCMEVRQTLSFDHNFKRAFNNNVMSHLLHCFKMIDVMFKHSNIQTYQQYNRAQTLEKYLGVKLSFVY